MPEKKNPRQGDVYLVKFHPSTGKEIRKYRPAVIMLNSQVDGFVTISPLTSILQIKHPQFETIIKSSKANGLEQTSLLLGWYLRTVDTITLQKRLGQLDSSDLSKIRTILRHLTS